MAVAYLLILFDVIPDFIPVLAKLDELIDIPLLAWFTVSLIPDRIIQECRLHVEAENDRYL